jgi:phosphoglycerol transferase
MESMETTYASTDAGGRQEGVNYMPLMTELASKYLTFTDKELGQLGGFHTPGGTTWTMAALLATTSGIPFSFPVGENGHNSMSRRESFATGLTTLGDILEEKGYRQEFLCGSDSVFGGRKSYFTQHGNYEIFDLFTARDEYYVPYDYHDKWWGFEDHTLYEIAKDELTELAANDQPFNFTMLTVDTHHVGGHRCRLCGYRYKDRIANVVTCADQQLAGFIAWCMEQDFYEDTVIIVTGDHPRMDTTYVDGLDVADRTIYNCIFNSAVQPQGSTSNRVFTPFDMFPTVLAAMGYTIEGERLGLGVNLFSAEHTLVEQIGYEFLNKELAKHSEFYLKRFT